MEDRCTQLPAPGSMDNASEGWCHQRPAKFAGVAIRRVDRANGSFSRAGRE
jgi:hypothetical protein